MPSFRNTKLGHLDLYAFHKHYKVRKAHLGESSSLYLTHTLRALALSLVGIYLPIYIFTLPGKYIFHPDLLINNLIWILLYYILARSVIVLFTLFASNVIFSELNFKSSILLSGIFLSTVIVLWSFAGSNPWLLILAGILNGFVTVFYWIPYHIFFIRKQADAEGHYGVRSATQSFLEKLMYSAGPLIGGIVIAFVGYTPLFMISLGLIIASVIPTFFGVSESHHHKHDGVAVANRYMSNPEYNKITWAFRGQAADAVIFAIFWPVFLYLILQNFVEIGSISTIATLGASVAVLLVGRVVDRYGPKKPHGIGVFFNTLFHFVRFVVKTPFTAYVLHLVDTINGALFTIPMLSETYEKGKRIGDSDFIIYREFTQHSAGLAVCLICLLMIIFLPDWRYVFLLAAGGSSLTYLMSLDTH